MAYMTRSSPTTSCVNLIAGAHATPLVVISTFVRRYSGMVFFSGCMRA